jgi:hypothetical protein
MTHDHERTRPQAACCCAHHVKRDSDSAGVHVCKCGCNDPVAPQSMPPQRGQIVDDLATSLWFAQIVTVDLPTARLCGWSSHLAAAFASASEHCISLCKLQS